MLAELDKKNLPHSNRVIKVLASAGDPRRELGKGTLATASVVDIPFSATEIFDYEGRQAYSGDELEAKLQAYELSQRGNKTVRALFRFANQHGFTQDSMTTTKGNGWLIEHPFGDIDGIDIATRIASREPLIHLDLFLPATMVALRQVVDYDNPDLVFSMDERMSIFRADRNAHS